MPEAEFFNDLQREYLFLDMEHYVKRTAWFAFAGDGNGGSQSLELRLSNPARNRGQWTSSTATLTGSIREYYVKKLPMVNDPFKLHGCGAFHAPPSRESHTR